MCVCCEIQPHTAVIELRIRSAKVLAYLVECRA